MTGASHEPERHAVSLDLVICTYNHERLLDRTLDAIAAQSVGYPVRWSVLVVDNNCTDGTAEVVARHSRQGRIPGLRRICEEIQGLTPARRRGMDATSADWIAFVDDDCLLARDWVEQAARFAAQAVGCGAFGGRVRLAWEVPAPDSARRYGWCFAQQEHGAEANPRDFLVGAGLVVRRTALEQCGWAERQHLPDRIGKRLVSGGDVEIALRIRGAGFSLWYQPSMELCYIIPGTRTSLGYMVRMTRSLGESHVLGQSLLCDGSPPRWLLAMAARTARTALLMLRRAACLIVGRGRWPDLLLDAGFVYGRMRGVTHLAAMRASRRRSLMGCAVLPAGGHIRQACAEKALAGR